MQEQIKAKERSDTYLEANIGQKAMDAETEETDLNTPDFSVDFQALQEMNPDIIGWIYIPGTQVNYPILQHPVEDSYYLSHTPENKSSKLGAIYMHHDTDPGFGDMHTILFGHNMKSGQMFGDLSNYADKEFAEKYPDVWILLPEEELHCIVYSAYICPIDDLTYTIGYMPGEESYAAFIRHTLTSSCISGKKSLTDMDQVITLSTCTDSGNAGKRFVVNCFIDEKSLKNN